jgi:hypothetical protein
MTAPRPQAGNNERLNTGDYLRYRIRQLLELRDGERERGADVDPEFIESVIKLCREMNCPDERPG